MVSNEAAQAQFTSPDAKAVVSITRAGESFRFVEERELWETPSNGLEGYAYWSETLRSGLYSSSEAALSAATKDFPWLSKAASHVR